MSFVRNLLIEQRKRAVGSLMGYIEREVAPRLDAGAQRELRAQVLRSINAYHDVSLDILKSCVSDDVVVNEEAIRLINELHARFVGQ